MLIPSIRAELSRLQLHPVNLGAISEENGQVLLGGSLMEFWKVPKSIDGSWFLSVLKGLPDNLGPQATMDAFFEAHTAYLSEKV